MMWGNYLTSSGLSFRIILLILISVILVLAVSACGEQKKSSSGGAGQPTVPGEGEDNIWQSTEIDTDGDGFVNAYDTEYLRKDIYVYGNGSIINPYLMSSIYQIQAIAGVDHKGVALDQSSHTNGTWMYGDNKTSQLGQNYLMVYDIDASATASWTSVQVNATMSIAGFTPIGDCDIQMSCFPDGVGAFNGRFSGGANAITGLHISRGATDKIGLFSTIGPRGVVSLLRLEEVKINGLREVGGLAGSNLGQIHASDVIGQVAGHFEIGILAGTNYGIINACSALGSVYGEIYTGGLIGQNNNQVEYSYSQAVVRGIDTVGGLVGVNRGGIVESYSNSIVAGNKNLGGIAGINYEDSVVDNSYAYGEVIGDNNIGGLVGINQHNAVVSSSHVVTVTSGYFNVGGLVGLNQGGIFLSYSEGNVTGTADIGGLVGDSNGTISTSHFEGNVTGENRVGGLVGSASNNITHSYALGRVRGIDKVGGLVGEYNRTAGIDASYAVTEVIAGNGKEEGGLVGSYPLNFTTDSHWEGAEFQTLSARSATGRISKQQLEECQHSSPGNDKSNATTGSQNSIVCQDIFTSDAWGQEIVHNNLSAGWYFEDPNKPPILLTRSVGAGVKLPVVYCTISQNDKSSCRTNILLNQVSQGQDIIRFAFDVAQDNNGKDKTKVEVKYEYDSLEAQPQTDLFVFDAQGLLKLARDPVAKEAGTYNIEISFIVSTEGYTTDDASLSSQEASKEDPKQESNDKSKEEYKTNPQQTILQKKITVSLIHKSE